MKHTVWLSLGGNMGDSRSILRNAVCSLQRMPEIEVFAVSSLYQTAPWGGVEQGDFLNICVGLRTCLNAKDMLTACRQLEAAAGRVRVIRWGERTLDVDILLYDMETSADPELLLPHPRMAERRFVLEPLAELCPEQLIPGALSVGEMLERCQDVCAVVKIADPVWVEEP